MLVLKLIHFSKRGLMVLWLRVSKILAKLTDVTYVIHHSFVTTIHGSMFELMYFNLFSFGAWQMHDQG